MARSSSLSDCSNATRYAGLKKKKVELLTYFVLSGLVIPSGPSIIKIEPLEVVEGALDKTSYHVTGVMRYVDLA